MRHIATFRVLVPDVDLAHWFVSQMKERGLAPSHTKTFDKYGHNVTGKRHGKEFQVTLAPSPTDPGRVVLHVEPALGFWAGLRGRPDRYGSLRRKPSMTCCRDRRRSRTCSGSAGRECGKAERPPHDIKPHLQRRGRQQRRRSETRCTWHQWGAARSDCSRRVATMTSTSR